MLAYRGHLHLWRMLKDAMKYNRIGIYTFDERYDANNNKVCIHMPICTMARDSPIHYL